MDRSKGTMESLEMTVFSDIYRSSSILLTGHTGFKGSWLALWLKTLGAEVTGLALEPNSKPSHWDLLALDMIDKRIDIRDAEKIKEAINIAKPKIVFHLAAQPLVRRSYSDPLDTWSTNVMGTVNLLEACRQQPSVKAIIVITSDKCYENKERVRGYKEGDRLGGHDPYSASKASAELAVSSYRKAFFNMPDSPLIASVRAGNVIGGGDWSEDRLIPDMVRAINDNRTLEIRSPNATRPWQHILESLSGYLSLGQKMLEGKKDFAQAWNFGPNEDGNRTVGDVLLCMKNEWPVLDWKITQSPQPHEANLLYLDSSKAHQYLEWKPVWSIDESIKETAAWYRALSEQGKVVSSIQLEKYTKKAQLAGLKWSLS
ncbi:CDP-glucose 4,6-dehydratase [Gammaproteobacteria bacterium]|nr:CDP-glucose 4,6-dehydratase [Gammaproteobacteria bacterium]